MSSANIKVTASVLSVDIDKPKIVIPQADYGSVEVDIQGLGETNYPEPRQFKYTDDEYSIHDYPPKFLQVKGIHDTKSTTQLVSFNSITRLNDIFGKLDTVQLKTEFIRSYNDTFNKSDVLALYSSKDTREYFSQLDTVTLKTEFIRNILDTVYTTDDVLGDLNTDDDQYAIVGKGIVDVFNKQEEFITEVDFNRLFSDTKSYQDTFNFIINTTYEETTTNIDSVSLVSQKVLSTNAGTDEIHSVDIGKVIVDSDYFLEDYTYQDYEYGSVSLIEYLSANTSKVLSNIFNKADSTKVGLQNYSYGDYVESGYVGILQIV